MVAFTVKLPLKTMYRNSSSIFSLLEMGEERNGKDLFRRFVIEIRARCRMSCNAHKNHYLHFPAAPESVFLTFADSPWIFLTVGSIDS